MSAQVPIIDFSRFIGGDAGARLDVAKEIADAFRTYGFVHLTNHPIPPSSISMAFRQSKLFFDLPVSSKSKAPHPPGFKVHRGYSHIGLEKISNLTASTNGFTNGTTNGTDDAKKAVAHQIPDLKESYDIGSEHNVEQPNVWPPPNLLPGYRGFMTGFYWTLAEFAREILRALALGIGLEEEHLFKFYEGEHNQLRLLHYPEVEARILEEGCATRISAHCDWSAFTMLFQDDCGGLEVESPTTPGKFITVEPIEHACLVNIGDLMARWSNDFLKSTSHRVGLPPLLQNRCAGDKRTTRSRYSIAYFVTTPPDAIIECLPSCIDEAHPAKYAPITQREYNLAKASLSYL
ncbi:2-oxoglutarate-Fe(II) type oxidoreductase ppzD [Drechslerella dactyloides]|uniref:2-oxoglutarate-Fe(II) type oxidoreductase ppzD n=1 Tax=Drechslerella dactyloides TaxID=74499 RepID=A0AAD6J710_DREDA|nr:2-oxoglutarate-Fe(II) type oxidoreductase ppzD [Drechslerella dactyloides]